MFCSANRVPAAVRRRGSESARAASGRRAARCNGASPSDPPRAHGRPRQATPSRSRRSRLAFLSRRCEAPVGGDSGRRPAAIYSDETWNRCFMVFVHVVLWYLSMLSGATRGDARQLRHPRDSDPRVRLRGIKRCAGLGSEMHGTRIRDVRDSDPRVRLRGRSKRVRLRGISVDGARPRPRRTARSGARGAGRGAGVCASAVRPRQPWVELPLFAEALPSQQLADRELPRTVSAGPVGPTRRPDPARPILNAQGRSSAACSASIAG